MNISTHNIYFDEAKSEVFFGKAKIHSEEDYDICYSGPEFVFRNIVSDNKKINDSQFIRESIKLENEEGILI